MSCGGRLPHLTPNAAAQWNSARNSIVLMDALGTLELAPAAISQPPA